MFAPGRIAPTALVGARVLAHHAVQWATKAARANLAPASDDSHSSLEWDARERALVSQPLPGGVRVGLRIADLHLLVLDPKGGKELSLHGDSGSGRWLDEALASRGLKPASNITLPYAVSKPDSSNIEDPSTLAELALWFESAAETLEEFRSSLGNFNPSPVRCWPHHFDIATLVVLESGDPEHARSIGVGVSPGDDYYAQPYAYVSPWPKLDAKDLPALPPGGHWHSKDFVAGVATAEEILALPDRRAGLLGFITGAFEIGRRRLHG